MATQFDYFGFKYEILEDKKNEVALIDATSGQGRVIVPKQVENEGKTYTVTVIGYRLVKDYRNVETDKRKKVNWVECEAKKVGAFEKYKYKYVDRVSELSSNLKMETSTNQSVTSIILPDSIKIIDELAFCRCTHIEEINIPNSVTSIGDNAFYSCYALKELVIPDSVTSIGNGAFYSCFASKNYLLFLILLPPLVQEHSEVVASWKLNFQANLP